MNRREFLALNSTGGWRFPLKNSGQCYLIFGTVLACGWFLGICSYVKARLGLTQMTVNGTMLFTISLILDSTSSA